MNKYMDMFSIKIVFLHDLSLLYKEKLIFTTHRDI